MRELVRRCVPSVVLFFVLAVLVWVCSYVAYLLVSVVYGGRFVWSAAVFSPWSFFFFSLKASALLSAWAVAAVSFSSRFMFRAPWLVGLSVAGSLCLVFLFALFVGAADRLVFIGL